MPTSLTELFSPACHLCPRRCGAARDEGAHGVCGANDTLKVARAALHMWEEPPISGEAGSGAIFFSGCSLKWQMVNGFYSAIVVIIFRLYPI